MARIKQRWLALAMALVVMAAAMPATSYAQEINERPSGLAMITDALLVRPIMVAGTVLGTGAYVVTLPFSLAGGNAKETGETLVVAPFESAFFRCLGCTPVQEENLEEAPGRRPTR